MSARQASAAAYSQPPGSIRTRSTARVGLLPPAWDRGLPTSLGARRLLARMPGLSPCSNEVNNYYGIGRYVGREGGFWECSGGRLTRRGSSPGIAMPGSSYGSNSGRFGRGDAPGQPGLPRWDSCASSLVVRSGTGCCSHSSPMRRSSGPGKLARLPRSRS